MKLPIKFFNRLARINFYLAHLLITLFITAFLIPSQSWSNNDLKVGVSRYAPPFSFIEENEVIPQGFCVDLAKLLADNLDLEASIYAFDDQELINALIDGSVDIVIGIRNDSYFLPNIFLLETSARVDRRLFVNRKILTINSYKDLLNRRVAIEKGRNLSWLLHSEININFIETESQKEALAFVDNGHADVYISENSRSTRYIIEENNFKNINEVEKIIDPTFLVIAVKNTNIELLTSIVKSYGNIIENQSYSSIYDKWFGHNINRFVVRYIKYIITFIVMSIIVLLVFIFWNYVLKSKVTVITKNLQYSEKKYRELIESSPDMIHLISHTGEIKLVNKIALKYLEYDENEMISLRLHDLILPEQAEDLTGFIEKVFRDKYSNKEFSFRAKNGKQIQVEMLATLVTKHDYFEDLACCFSRDITERKRLEENLLYADRLAVMGQMAAGIAHEINNPLGIILCNAQYVLNYELSKQDSIASMKSIERNAIRAAKIIEDLLTFTRPSPMNTVPIDLPKLIDNSLIYLKPKINQKNIKVEKNYPTDSIIFNGDERLIQQLLINIILNSIQAVRNEGLIKILMNVTGEDGDRKIIIEIDDNGTGMSEEVLKDIFNPFFTSRKENGFGLGLFISKIIVDKHHGSLLARSELKKGTVMTIEFPAGKINAPTSYRIINNENYL